jgi:hypothetical protein
MKTFPSLSKPSWNRFLAGLLFAGTCLFQTGAARAGDALVPNGDFEKGDAENQWPAHWPKPKEGGSWVEEKGNHFIRLTSPAPGANVMMYAEIPIPEGTKALEISWKHRITGLQIGAQKWFDARILMEFMDAAKAKVAPGPKVPAFRKDVPEWTPASVQFLVPEGAKTLKFMPALFQVAAGTWDIDDMAINPVDASAAQAAADAAAAEKAQKTAAAAESRQAKAAQILQQQGNLIVGGDYEGAAGKKNMATEEGNTFLKLQAVEPGKMTLDYREVDIPAGIQALELAWKQRVTGLKRGEKPWFDARIMMEWKDASGQKLAGKPGPSYQQKDTNGWIDKTTSFLVPEGAVTLVIMPTLFNVEAGTYELDNFVLKPADPAPILARKEAADKAAAARYVPPEAPDRAKWPKTLKVAGNRLHDTEGKEVWLQGVNAGGLETLPQDKQAVKSVVVAIDEWKSNCVRLPITEAFWYGKSPYQNDGGKDYRDTIDQIVTLAANRGAYVALDLHRFRAPKPEHAEFWKDAAAHFKDHPAVLFDIFNEPHGISWDVWKNGGFVGNKEGKDESAFLSEEEKKKNQGFESVGMQGLVDAVRSTGAKNIIIAGGLFWCNDLSGIIKGYALDDKGGNGIMYSWHTYNWHPNWARTLPVAEKYPIFLGEVGADVKKMDFIPKEAQEDPYTFIPDMLGFIQKHKINWTGWCLHPGASPVMITDWSYTPTPYWGVFAKRALAGEQFEMKRMR